MEKYLIKKSKGDKSIKDLLNSIIEKVVNRVESGKNKYVEINKLSKIHQKRKSLENHEKSRIESSSIVVHFNCTLKLVEQLSI